MTQGVFSIPLTSGSATAAGTPTRERSARSALLGEFVAGPENRLAAYAVNAIFEDSVAGISPLVLYGPSQAGKTHLARGLAAWWERHHPLALVQTLTAAEYAQQYADAVETDRVAAWRTKLRASRLLVIDDLRGIAGKRGAQQELRHLLDDLSARGALVVITSHSLPNVLPDVSAGLRSRLTSGLVVPVSIPAVATRQVLVERFAAAREMSLSKRATQVLAESLNVPAPILLGALMELDLAARDEGQPLDLDRIRRYVARHDREKPLQIREIAVTTAKYCGLRLSDLKSPSRRKAIVTARNLAVFLARQLTDESLDQIGEYFGGRDHTTILHGYRKTDKLAKTDPATKLAIAELKRLVSLAS